MAKPRRVGLAPPGSLLPARRRREKVMLAYPYGTFEGAFVTSLAMLLVHDAHHGRHVVDGGFFLPMQTTNLAHGRNQIVRIFLEQTTADWLWFVDTDQTFDADVLDRMLASADPDERPILGALVFSYSAGDAQQIVPTLWTIHDGQFARIMQVPDGQVIPLAATGTGCVLIHRTVLEGVRDMPVPGRSDGRTYGETSWPWFQYGDWENNEGRADVMGEDLTFFLRAAAAGYLTHVDTAIEVGHVKRISLGRADYDAQPIAPDAYPNMVIIPVKGRHDLTDTLVGQLVEQDEADLILILDNGAESDPYPNPHEVTVVPCEGKTLHEMWNLGADLARQNAPRSNLAFLNNDLEIGDRFLSRLGIVLRAHPRIMAVCPNYDGRPGEGFAQLHGICANRYDGTGGLAGFAFVLPAELFTAGFRFDERLQWWFGDNDLVLTIEQAGGIYGMALDVPVVHVHGGSQTSPRGAEWFEQAIREDSDVFHEKWAAR